VFARAPIPGHAKTRLIPMLGREGASRFQQVLLEDTLGKVQGLRAARYLFGSGGLVPSRLIYPALRYRRQRGRDLGERLQGAFRELLRRHERVILIGTDSPLLARDRLRLALEELKAVDAVLGPCPDGGYYLIGLRGMERGALKGVRWGSRFAFADTLERLLRAGLLCSVLESCGDIDRPRDFVQLYEQLRRRASLRRLAPAVWKFCRAWFAEAPAAESSRRRRRSSRRRPLLHQRRRLQPGRA
jgi:rSAM/selenodomain-associated transferase 1